MTTFDEIMTGFKEISGKPDFQERGAIGTLNFGGYLSSEEFNTDLRDDKAIETFDKMRRTDAQINATMLAIELPIRSAVWQIEAASEDSQDVKIKEFIEQNLFENDNFSWDNILRHALKYLQFGFYPFEKVYENSDGIRLKKLAPRKPITIKEWKQNDDGTLKEVQQFAYTPAGTYKTMIIPNESLLLFTNDQEGGNYRGVSILRPAYRNWLIKEKLIRIDAQRHDRQGLGVPMITLPEGATIEDKTTAEDVAETFRAHEKGYVILPNSSWKFEILDMQAGTTSLALQSIKWHNSEMTSNILAQFLDLGKTESGSRATAGELKDIFLLSLMATAKYIEDVFNGGIEGRKLIRDLVDFNFPNVKKYPKLKCTKIKSLDYTAVSMALKTLADAGIVNPDAPLESWVREAFELPKADETKKFEKKIPPTFPGMPPIPGEQQPGQQPPPQPEQKPGQNEIKGQTQKGMSGCTYGQVHLAEDVSAGLRAEYWRPLTDREKSIGLAEMDNKLRDYHKQLVLIGDQYRKIMIDELTSKGVSLLSKNVPLKKLVEMFEGIRAPMTGKMTNEITKVLRGVFDWGQGTVKTELNLKKLADPLAWDEDEAWDALKVYAEMSVQKLAQKLIDNLKMIIIQQKTFGDVDKYEIKDKLETLSKNDFADQMMQNVNRSFGTGRDSEALKNKDGIGRILRSEVMDQNTCGPCSKLDAASMSAGGFSPDDPIVDDFLGGPYIDCEGGFRCRGINIYESAEET